MRADGKIVKNVDPMYTLAPYFMRHRYDAQNMITVNVQYDNIHDYVIDARKRGIKLSHMTVVMAAIVRGFSQFPQLNRFVVNSKIYAHNELTAGMVVLRPGEGDPSMSKMKFDIYDTIFDVNDTINEYVEANNKEDSSNSSDKLFKVLLKMPFLVRIGMAILRGLDNLPLSLYLSAESLPQAREIIEDNTNYNTEFIEELSDKALTYEKANPNFEITTF